MTLSYCTHSDHWRLFPADGKAPECRLPNYRNLPWNCTVHKPKPRYRWDYAQNQWVEVK